MDREGWKVWAAGLALLVAVDVAAQEAPRAATGTVVGTVRTEAGLAVVRAEVTIDGTNLRAVTGDDGGFSLVGVPAGTVRVIARRLGYTPARRDVTVPAQGSVRVELALSRAPVQMDAIAVTARREVSDFRLAGFRDRAEKRAGGHFITRDRIEQSANRSAIDALRGIPGVRFQAQSAQRGGGQLFGPQTIRFRSANCPPLVFIDGFAATASEFDLGSIDLHMVEGIEIYLSSTTVPPEFLAARGLEQCGVIAIWSRPAQARPPRTRQQNEAEVEKARATALTLEQVDRAAYVIGGTPEISYPDSLWRSETRGQVTVEFVVDERGRLNWSTIRVMEESHPLFTRAVLEGLATTQWQPAQVAGRAVPQLVVLPVRFSRAAGQGG